MELTRNLAWGVRIGIDEDGVTRRGFLARTAMRWDELDDYRLEVRMRSAPGRRPFELVSALSGTAPLVYAIELRSGRRRLRIDSFFEEVPQVVGLVIARIGDRLAARARAELRETGAARFGPLRLTSDAVQWAGREALPRERVEVIDLLETSPVRLRVMERGRVFAYGSAATSRIPSLHVALAIARELGYQVRDGEVMRVLDAPPISLESTDR